MKQLLYVFLVVVLAGCIEPVNPQKIYTPSPYLYDNAYDSGDQIAVSFKSVTYRWWASNEKYTPALKTAKKTWWRTNGPTTRPTTQPTSRPVHDVVVVLTPHSVKKKVVKSEIIASRRL